MFNILKERLAWWIARKELTRLALLEHRMAELYRWCAEFDQMCDAIDWIRNGQQDISPWREDMRHKYPSVLVSGAVKPASCCGCICGRCSHQGGTSYHTEECSNYIYSNFAHKRLPNPNP